MELNRELAIEIKRQLNLAARQRRESLILYLLGGAALAVYFLYKFTSLQSEKEFFYLLGAALVARILLPLAIATSFAARPSGLACCPVCRHSWGLESVWAPPVTTMLECEKCQTKLDERSLQEAIEPTIGSP